jgi:formyl-CoA transferase
MAPRNAYRAADGRWVAITAGTDDLVVRLFEAIGRPELARDGRFRTNRDRVANVDALDALVGDWIAARPAAAAVDALLANRVSAAVVDDVPAVLANEHFRTRGEIVGVDDPEAGTITTSAPGIGGLGAIRHLGRDLGADNAAIYEEWLGVDATDLALLRAAGIV